MVIKNGAGCGEMGRAAMTEWSDVFKRRKGLWREKKHEAGEWWGKVEEEVRRWRGQKDELAWIETDF